MVLVVQSDQKHQQRIRDNLTKIGIRCECTGNGVSGFHQFLSRHYALVILDVYLNDGCGLDICQRIRQHNFEQPIMFVSASVSDTDRILGLELGADDFLSEPYCNREFQARVKVQLRHHQAHTVNESETKGHELRVGPLLLDEKQHYAEWYGREIELTAKEFTLLGYLARNPNQVFTRAQLLQAVWGYAHNGYEHNINSHINRLRNKLNRCTPGGGPIQTVWGVGYKFTPANCEGAQVRLAHAQQLVFTERA
ncbi:DNA-binding response regulator [Alteromonas aestuariivivens]|uniref:Phosphate regulon transcriptional regulatory protein PhoB n=1 Tax=Alteromonas aestuariivivens TaxID=1938339 RepID=A0A3D8MC56_9ALTE|nr:response regulator transcription factor [Alteromonas aestuariivivens]RDV28098.1 DNA-binding response regulator [Alteromonas aestuariivivens]